MARQDEVDSPSELIDARIAELSDWRGETLAHIRDLIRQADPDVVEEWKWRGVPVWSHDGMICTGETYKDKVKVTFAKGASVDDPAGLFNASLEGNARRAIDLYEGDELDEPAFASLVQAAAALNATRTKPTSAATGKRAATATDGSGSGAAEPRLLAGGNPQIPKGDGDGPVQDYIAAMPGWKRDVGRRLDALVERTVPDVQKAVKWNNPLYGVEDQGWFCTYRCFTKYVKVAFFRGASLEPLPPVDSKDENTRYFHIHEGDELDEELLASWVRQASQLPGWVA